MNKMKTTIENLSASKYIIVSIVILSFFLFGMKGVEGNYLDELFSVIFTVMALLKAITIKKHIV
jgi:hypothetical protein